MDCGYGFGGYGYGLSWRYPGVTHAIHYLQVCPFRVFQRLGGRRKPPRYVVRFFRPFGEGLPPCHVPFAFFNVPWWRNPLVVSISYFQRAVVGKPSLTRCVHFFQHAGVGRPSCCVNFVFSMCRGGETLSVTSRSLYSTFCGGEILPLRFFDVSG